MNLLTYRLNIEALDKKKNVLWLLNERVLYDDNYWHYFLDPGGVTLRFGQQNKYTVVTVLKKLKVSYKVAANYDPKKDEYWGVKYLGDDILPIFHEISVLTVKFPHNVILKQVLERVNHALVNQCGLHRFSKEAEIYADLALRRAEAAGEQHGE